MTVKNHYHSLYDATSLKFVPNNMKSMTDAEGLDKAYASPDSTYINGDTEYIAGTKGDFTGNDWMQNYKYIGLPFITNNKVQVAQTNRYKQARATLFKHPEVKRVVGHSLGGAVALELKKDDPNLTERIYGTPYYDPFGMYRRVDGVKRSRT